MASNTWCSLATQYCLVPDKHVAAFLLGDDGFEWIDLERESLAAACMRGRVWIFVANVGFATSETYAVRTANFHEREGGPLGCWSFATAGLYHGEPFLVGNGGLGLFTEPERSALLVARPSHYESRLSQWIWAARSSVTAGDKLQVVVDAMLLPAVTGQVKFLLPRSSADSNVMVLRCGINDDRGDPLAIVDTRVRPSHGILRIGQVLHFFARPNQRDQQGRLLFAAKATRSTSGDAVVHVPFEEGGIETAVELVANFEDKAGNAWFLRYPNAKDEVRGLPLVLISLRMA